MSKHIKSKRGTAKIQIESENSSHDISNQSIVTDTKISNETDPLFPDFETPASFNEIIPEYTSSEELNEIQAGDNTLRIVGYVDSIIGTKTVGRKRSLDLFKFTLNNADNCRITVLIWEDQIPKYEALIKFREIVEMINVKSLPLDPLFNKREDGFVNFELSVQRNTQLNFFGPASTPTSLSPEIEEIDLKYAGAYSGLKSIQGYLSVEFSRVTTGSGSCSFASAAMTDGSYKLRFQVANYAPNSNLRLGSRIQITGYLKKDKYESTYLQVANMSDIKILFSEKILEVAELRKGFRAPLVIMPTASTNQASSSSRTS